MTNSQEPKKDTPVKTPDDLPTGNGPGAEAVDPKAHKLVQPEDGLDPHRRSGDRNVDVMGKA